VPHLQLLLLLLPAFADDVHARDKSAVDAAVSSATGRGRKRKRKQGEAEDQQQQQQQQHASKKKGKDEEFGVTRGIDFKGVRSVINYDIPDSLQVGTGVGGGGCCRMQVMPVLPVLLCPISYHVILCCPAVSFVLCCVFFRTRCVENTTTKRTASITKLTK
jgi:hypothetical protein